MAMLKAETKPSAKPIPRPDVDPVAAGRAGGVASGEARRARKEQGPRHWGEVLLDEVAADPERIVRNLLRSKNGAALAKALEFVRDLENGKLQRLRNVDRRTTELDELVCQLMDDVEREQQLKARLRAEVDELQRRRQELQAAIEAEASQAGFELVDEPEGGGDAALAQTSA